MFSLTTITPYWRRPATLRLWLNAVSDALLPGMKSMVVFVGDPIPDWVRPWRELPQFVFVHTKDVPGDRSIAHYHNLGAAQADTEWIMKLDVDTFPHVTYFHHLESIVQTAGKCEWFNGGMMYLTQAASSSYLCQPILEEDYDHIVHNWSSYSSNGYPHPAATNFVCRRKDYLSFGGCDSRFKGYGWEDYSQIYMLERHQLGNDPLPGPITLQNVTQRCRDEISRRKALELFRRNGKLCLFHHWHPTNTDQFYRNARIMGANRLVLLENILTSRK